ATGLNPTQAIMFNQAAGGLPTQILEGNRLFGPAGLFVRDNTDAASLREGSPISTATSASGANVVAGINRFGEGLVIRSVGPGWDARPLFAAALPGHAAPVVRDVEVYVDARDGRAYAAAIVDGRLLWFAPNAGGFYPQGIDLASAGQTTI